MRKFLLLLLIMPILEIWLMIKIGSEIGALATIAWLITAVILGINILRFQGAATMLRAAQDMRTGSLPAQALVDGIIKSIGAVLLILPGFATDVIAVVCFIPLFRRLLLKRWIAKTAMKTAFMAANFRQQGFNGDVYEHHTSTHADGNKHLHGRIIEHEPHKKD